MASVEGRVLVEALVQGGIDEDARGIEVGVHRVIQRRSGGIELGDDAQFVTEQREVLRVRHADVRADDDLHVAEVQGPHRVRDPRLDGEVRLRVERDDLVASRAARGAGGCQEKLGGRGLDAVDGGDLVAGGLVHVEVGGFGTHQERLWVKVIGVRGRHHDVRAEA